MKSKSIFPFLVILLFVLAISRLSCPIERYGDLARSYERILKKDPTDIKALMRCAEAYYQQAERVTDEKETIRLFDKAIEYYRRLIALDGNRELDPTIYLHLGIAYFKKSLILQGDYFYHEAEVELKKALSKNPLLEEAHLYLGHLYYQVGRKREATAEYRKAGRLGLVDPVSHFNLACDYKEKGFHSEAKELFKRLIRRKDIKKDILIDSRLALGWLYYNDKDFARAIREYKEAVRLDSSSVKAHYWLGKAYKASNDNESARQEFLEVLKIDPDHKEAKSQLADKPR